jgi:hypothetical protein
VIERGNPNTHPHRRYGFISDPEGHMRTPFARCKASRVTASSLLPPSADLRYNAPPVTDQGDTGSCTGHATSCAISTSLRCAGIPLVFEPSERGIYTIGRCIDRVPDTNGVLPPLTDDGAMPNQIDRGISEWGVRPRLIPATADGRNSDCEVDTINQEPQLGDLESDAGNLMVGSYAITSSGQQKRIELMLALSSGFACRFAYGVDAAFQVYAANSSPLGAASVPSNHYLCALGYRFDDTGHLIIIFRNSWGTSWGIDGDGEGDEAFIESMDNIYVTAVHEIA